MSCLNKALVQQGKDKQKVRRKNKDTAKQLLIALAVVIPLTTKESTVQGGHQISKLGSKLTTNPTSK